MISSLIRSSLQGFKPYSSARSEAKEGSVFLDANELSLRSPVEAPEGVVLNRYPDPEQRELREKIAELYQKQSVGSEDVFAGVGSDEIIDLLIRLFCEPGKDSVLTFNPTYGVYQVAAALSGVKLISVDLNENFGIDLERTLASIEPTTKLLFCCSPNNPTGNLLAPAALLELCDRFRGIVVVDQAYAEFANGQGLDLVAEAVRRPNLVILRTFSKAWGLAGIRLGYCIAQPEIIQWLLKIKAPYSINVLTQDAGLRALRNRAFLDHSVSLIRSERARLVGALPSLACVAQVFPSDANYLLVQMKNRDEAFKALLARGIVVRKRSERGLQDCLRITVGTSAENSLVLNTLAEVKP